MKIHCFPIMLQIGGNLMTESFASHSCIGNHGSSQASSFILQMNRLKFLSKSMHFKMHSKAYSQSVFFSLLLFSFSFFFSSKRVLLQFLCLCWPLALEIMDLERFNNNFQQLLEFLAFHIKTNAIFLVNSAIFSIMFALEQSRKIYIPVKTLVFYLQISLTRKVRSLTNVNLSRQGYKWNQGHS